MKIWLSGLFILGEKQVIESGDTTFAGAFPSLAKTGRGVFVRLGGWTEIRERLDRVVDRIVAERIGKLRVQRRFRLVGDAEQALEREALGLRPIVAAAMVFGHLSKLGALADHRIDHLANVIAGGEGHHRCQRPAERAVAIVGGAGERRVERGTPQACLLVLVEHRKMRGHSRFEREALQQPLAEAVDGVDLEAAFGFESAREQTPRQAQHLLVWRPPRELFQFLGELPALVRRPCGERLQEAVLHLGRRGLGVGQAQDRFRREAFKQEPQHALDEDRGLAGARARRHPGRSARVGGARLVGVGLGRKGRVAAHPNSSSASCVSHSLMRARCSYSSYL